MNVANLGLCKELYKLSGWEPEDWYDSVSGYVMTTEDKLVLDNDNDGDAGLTPAYDLGYLLRKLPTGTMLQAGIKDYRALSTSIEYIQHGVTPEDAAAKLAIELHRQGVLRPNSELNRELGRSKPSSKERIAE